MFSSFIFSDPIGLILHRPLLKLRKLISEESLREKNVPYPREAKQDVTLVVGFSSTISNKDLELSRDVLETIKSENPGENHFIIYLLLCIL